MYEKDMRKRKRHKKGERYEKERNMRKRTHEKMLSPLLPHLTLAYHMLPILYYGGHVGEGEKENS